MSAPRGLRLFAVLSLAAGAVLLPSAPSAPAASAAVPGAATLADVDDFGYASWGSDYQVSLDDEGRAVLHATETLVAEFPEYDQNRGIVRGFPMRYEGASTDPRILSVTDENGAAVPFETETDDDVLYVLTGTDEYVHGSTTYVITYEMRNVMLAADTGVDEFYWDMLPMDSTQSIGLFTGRVAFDDELDAHLTGASRCYTGPHGSTTPCALEETDGVFTVSEADLAPGDGVTVAIAFDAGTATQPDSRLPNPVTDVVPLGLSAGALTLVAGGWFSTAALVRSRRRATGIVVAQYNVPATMPPILANAIVRRPKNPVTAQIIHLAVRGLIRLEELPDKDDDRRPRLRRLDAPIPDPLDHRALKAVFNNDEPGIVMTVPKDSEAFAGRMGKLIKAGTKAAATRGLTTKERSRTAIVLTWLGFAVFAAALGLAIWGLVQARDTAVLGFVLATIGLGIALFSTIFAMSRRAVLTPEGAAAAEHLEGVREFIRVAEADRLRMLQSYTGAERRPDGTVDVVHLYERLLPYAILFGQEKEWGEVLETAYSVQQQSPAWVDGAVTGLAVRMSVFSHTTSSASSYSSPSSGSSSSFGGSSGGGFSGGGGGGGFSGGR